jgi:hypothetical protein
MWIFGRIWREWRRRSSQPCLSPSRGLPRSRLTRLSLGAGEGIRTLDPDLGKVVLYH